IVLTAATVAIAWRTAAATAAVPVAAILAAAVMAHWAVHEKLDALIAPAGVTAPAIPGPEHFDYGPHFAIAAFWAALFGIAGFLAQGRWTLFSSILWVGSMKVHKAMFATFTTLMIGFICLDLAHFGAPKELFTKIAAVDLIVCALLAWYMMAGVVLNDLWGRPVVPMGKPVL
ncbi:MAG: GPR1/FUN34/YaaH family transporter, partial [Bacteroidales bacterium]